MKLDRKHNFETLLRTNLRFVTGSIVASVLVMGTPVIALAKASKAAATPSAVTSVKAANTKLASRSNSKSAQKRAIDKLLYSQDLTARSTPSKKKAMLLAQAEPVKKEEAKEAVTETMAPVFAPPRTAPPTGVMSASVPAEKEAGSKSWFIETGVEQSSNMRKETDPTAEVATSVSITPGYKITDKLTASAAIAIEKQQTGAGDTTVSDASLALSLKGWTFSNPAFSTVHILTGFAPTSENSLEDDKLKGAVSLGNRLVMKPSFGGSYSYTLGYRQNFHEFNVNRDGKANIQRTISHRILTETPLFGSKFSLLGDGIFRNSYTYGNTMKDGFTFSADLGYSATDAFSVYVGTTNQGSALRAGSAESNIEVFNDKTSVLRAGLTYVL